MPLNINVYIPYITHLICIYCTHLNCYILPSLCNTCITSLLKQCHLYMFIFPTLLISYVYTVLYTIYCILPMPFCAITHSYIFMYIFFIPLHLCVSGSSCGIVRLDYSLVITALSELDGQAFRYTHFWINSVPNFNFLLLMPRI